MTSADSDKQTSDPKFQIGDEVHVMGVINVTERVVGLMYDPKTQRPGESGYRYRVTGSPAYFYESDLATPEEIQARLEDEGDDELDYPEYEYDGDTGCAFINGEWRIVSQTQWERWQRQ